MTRSVIATLSFFFIVPIFLQADIFTEDFEGGLYTDGQAIVGTHDWAGIGQAGWFQARATGPSDPAFLGEFYGSLSNNAQGTSSTDSWLYQQVPVVSSGSARAVFDARFSAGGTGGLDSCIVYVSDSDRTPGSAYHEETIASIKVDQGDFFTVHHINWMPVLNVPFDSDTWYRLAIDVNLTGRTWSLQITPWNGSSWGGTLQAEVPGGITDFAFRGTTADDVGLMEFLAMGDVMNDPSGRGFMIDNVAVPEPASLLLLSAFSPVLLGRRKPHAGRVRH